jgi:hypothetical protein
VINNIDLYAQLMERDQMTKARVQLDNWIGQKKKSDSIAHPKD